MADKVDDKIKKTVKKSSTESRSNPKTTHKGNADIPPEASVSQDASFSGDNDNDDYGNCHPLTKRKRSEASTSVSLDLFHDFLGKLDERFSALESGVALIK